VLDVVKKKERDSTMQLNQFNVIGRIGKDGVKEIEGTKKPMCVFSLANDQSYKDKEGNRTEQTEWFNVVVYGGYVKTCLESLKQGSKIRISGKLHNKEFETKDGDKRHSTELVINQSSGEIEFLDKKEK